ncbi:hypothetical protein [Actinosynnema sp. NPDC020468]|uniref:hypothetical protein n=1 Tax=Actinosynnema sp. NPDC020468 TaxID=3154488 RepID=UPI0033F40D1E
MSTWPEAITTLGVLVVAMIVVLYLFQAFLDLRKLKTAAAQADALRHLVDRYEQLASGTLDAQQRAAADVAELRTRTASIEQILRSVG